LYLTFDDGPTPGVTDYVLEQLAAYEAKATFFSIGDKARKFPETLLKVQAAGHTIGNHTFNHLDLWKTPVVKYLHNAAEGHQAILEVTGRAPQHFRPPYGKITHRAARRLTPDYTVVMWDVIAGDWNPRLSAERVTQNIFRQTRNGSIIVLHDSEKAQDRMKPALAATLAHFAAQGYRFEAL
jgi:peptidoglycan-N-acetylglucosamine deacetylase